jgi:hypothetical protein
VRAIAETAGILRTLKVLRRSPYSRKGGGNVSDAH